MLFPNPFSKQAYRVIDVRIPVFMRVFLSACMADEIQKHTLSLSLSVSLSFSLKNSGFFFYIQVVLSHGQHQHLIKPKDKHWSRSTAELISSPGSISQLLSICPNTNLLFFTGKKRGHQNNADRSMFLGLFRNMIMQRSVDTNLHGLSSASVPSLWIVITSFFTSCVLRQPGGKREVLPKNRR